jgi:hypothetical protein
MLLSWCEKMLSYITVGLAECFPALHFVKICLPKSRVKVRVIFPRQRGTYVLNLSDWVKISDVLKERHDAESGRWAALWEKWVRRPQHLNKDREGRCRFWWAVWGWNSSVCDCKAADSMGGVCMVWVNWSDFRVLNSASWAFMVFPPQRSPLERKDHHTCIFHSVGNL